MKNLMFCFMQPLHSIGRPDKSLSTRLQWTEKGRPIDVQYGAWTSMDVPRTSDAHWDIMYILVLKSTILVYRMQGRKAWCKLTIFI